MAKSSWATYYTPSWSPVPLSEYEHVNVGWHSAVERSACMNRVNEVSALIGQVENHYVRTS